jgi:hypothetical protein
LFGVMFHFECLSSLATNGIATAGAGKSRNPVEIESLN